MLNDAEAAEQRALRRRAYGPDGELAVDEMRRLHELDEKARRAARPHPLSRDPLPRFVERAEGESKRAEQAERVEAIPPGTSVASPSFRRLVIAAASALLIGLGAGWMLWAWDGQAYALAGSHADERAEIEATGRFDAESITPLVEKHGVVIWRAENSELATVCVIVTTEDRLPQSGCSNRDALIDDAAWATVSATVPEGQERAGSQLMAVLVATPAGEIIPLIQVWDPKMTIESEYSEAEKAELEQIEEAGFQTATLTTFGKDGAHTIWIDWQSGYACIIAAGDDGYIQACAEDAEGDIILNASVDGVATGYVVTQSDRGAQLIINKYDGDPDYYFGTADDAAGTD